MHKFSTLILAGLFIAAAACSDGPTAPSVASGEKASVRKPTGPNFTIGEDNAQVEAMHDTASALSATMAAEPTPSGAFGGSGQVTAYSSPSSGRLSSPSGRGKVRTSFYEWPWGIPFTCREIYNNFYNEKYRFDDNYHDYWYNVVTYNFWSARDNRYEMQDALSAMKMWVGYWRQGDC